MKQTFCLTCSRSIQFDDEFHCDKHNHPPMQWFTVVGGALCIGGRLHIPWEKPMRTYTEAEIRAAWERTFNGKITPGAFLGELKGETMNDTDTVTVKEIRDSLKRKPGLVSWSDLQVDMLLLDILQHREPEYPMGTVVRDKDRIHWYRTSGNQWYQFGSSMKFTDEAPKRPLTVVSGK